EVGIAIVVEIHLRAVEELEQALTRQREARDSRAERAHHEMVGVARETGIELVSPPQQLGARYPRIGGRCNSLDEFTAEGVQGDDRVPLLDRQEQNAVVKA